jgi:hypothetical protein
LEWIWNVTDIRIGSERRKRSFSYGLLPALISKIYFIHPREELKESFGAKVFLFLIQRRKDQMPLTDIRPS